MAIDPKQMAAFAAAGPKPGASDAAGDSAEQAEGGDEGGGDDMQEGGSGRFGELIPMLEANAEELAACCEELDPEALMDTGTALSGDNLDILTESVLTLPEDLLAEMMATLEGVTVEEADEITAHLEDEGTVDDAAPISAMLVHIGKLIESGDLSVEDAEDGEAEPDDDAEDSDDEESDDELDADE